MFPNTVPALKVAGLSETCIKVESTICDKMEKQLTLGKMILRRTHIGQRSWKTAHVRQVRIQAQNFL
jgi:hypothetical protein